MRRARRLVYRPKQLADPAFHLLYVPGTSTGARTAWIFSFTGVSNEPRVLRQAAALVEAGWRVVVLGHEGHSVRPPGWYFVRLPVDPPYALPARLVFLGLQAVGTVVTRFGVLPAIRRAGARLFHAFIPGYAWRRKQVRKFRTAHPELRPDLVISHDYFTADVGLETARHFGARFSVDCHEYARGQYMHDEGWVRTSRPYVSAFQDHYLARADAVTTVCQGIAELLNGEQKLRRPVEVIRSVPFPNIQPFRPTGERITVLYHGEIFYLRGLHKAVRSMAMWRPEFQLLLRGNSDPRYVEDLWRIAEEVGVTDRLSIEPPVQFAEIVPAANQADIGYFVHKDLSPQKRFVLPNKFFEYAMAGLALCVSDLPEMARLVREYGFGRLVPEYDERAIAAVINSFDRDSIDFMKQRSIEAAAALNWDKEKYRMLEFYESIL
jgi:glycogen synthase